MPFNPAGRDEGGLDGEQQHPEREGSAVDVKDGAGERRAQHAGAEVSGAEADVHADAEQDGHARVEDAFRGPIDGAVDGLLAGNRHYDGVSCHWILLCR